MWYNKPMRYFFYRNLMLLAHKFDWHHAPVIGPISPDGDYQRWCTWCGFRQSFRKDSPGMIQ